MESKWRQNVSDLMFSYSDWRLAARVTEVTPFPLLLVDRGVPGTGFVYWRFAPGQLPEVYPITPTIPTTGNFPWGIEVEPD